MQRSSGRAQVEPLAALAAVLAVTAGLTLYAGTLDDAVPPERERNVADPTLQRVLDTIEAAGAVDPAQLDIARARVPDGWRANLTLRADGNQWTSGPPSPARADSVTARVSVSIAPMQIRPGQLRVAVWQ